MRRLFAWLVPIALVVGSNSVLAQKCGQPMKVPAGTPKEQIAKLVVNQMFDQIKLTDAQEQRAVQIVTAWMTDHAELDRGAADFRQRAKALDAKRDADLLALLTNDADKAKLTACFRKMEPRGG